jgi:hypothetical protein
VRAFLRAAVVALLAASYGCAEEAAKAAEHEGIMPMAPAPMDRVPEFKAYIFWAYGLACLLLFLFTLWTVVQLRRVEGKVDYLTRTSPPGREGSKSGGEG